MSVATTSLRPSTSSPRVQISMDREARSPQVGIRASVSRTGRPKSSVTNRRAPERERYDTLMRKFSLFSTNVT